MRRTLHHSGLQAASDEGQYVASCCRERHCQQAREFLQPDTQEQQRDKLVERKESDDDGPNKVEMTDQEHQRQLVAHNFHA